MTIGAGLFKNAGNIGIQRPRVFFMRFGTNQSYSPIFVSGFLSPSYTQKVKGRTFENK